MAGVENGERAVLNQLRNRHFSPRLSNGTGSVSRNSTGGMSDADATVVARTWGYDFKTTYGNGRILTFLRQDAPELDVVGGPAREVVGQVPKAREEAERIRAQTGCNVLDPNWYGPVEAAAGKNAKQRERYLQGFVGIGIANAILTAWAIAYIGEPISLVLGVPSLIGWGFVARWVGRFVALAKEYGADIKPKVNLIRQVLDVAEEELLSGS